MIDMFGIVRCTHYGGLCARDVPDDKAELLDSSLMVHRDELCVIVSPLVRSASGGEFIKLLTKNCTAWYRYSDHFFKKL